MIVLNKRILNLMVKSRHNFSTLIVTLGLAAFIVVSILGVWHSFGMETNQEGEMSGCIFAGEAAICKMSAVEHISLWQSMFAALPQELALLIMTLIILVAVLVIRQHSLSLFDKKIISEWRLYLTQHIDLPLFNPVRRAFSKGILHPRIYESAIF